MSSTSWGVRRATLGGLWHDEVVQASALTGKLLVASHLLLDPNFYRTVILILAHDSEEGAMGLVLNRETSEMAADYLPAWTDRIVPPGRVHYGGPVEPAMAIGLGRVVDDPGVAGFGLVDLSSGPAEDSPSVRVYAGYAGWSPGQLEDELDTNSWFVVDAAPDDPLADPSTLWHRVLRRQEGSLSMLSTLPDDPTLN